MSIRDSIANGRARRFVEPAVIVVVSYLSYAAMLGLLLILTDVRPDSGLRWILGACAAASYAGGVLAAHTSACRKAVAVSSLVVLLVVILLLGARAGGPLLGVLLVTCALANAYRVEPMMRSLATDHPECQLSRRRDEVAWIIALVVELLAVLLAVFT